MSELATLARPYAEAVYKRAKETSTSEQWSEALGFLAEVMSDERLSRAARNPRVEKEGFSELLLDVCQGQIHDEGERFVKLLIQNNRLNLAGPIRVLFEQYRAEDEGYVAVDVKTAYPVPEKEQGQLATALESSFNKKVHLSMEEDSSLIGGVLIRAGDQVIDGSVRGQLQQLAKQLCS